MSDSTKSHSTLRNLVLICIVPVAGWLIKLEVNRAVTAASITTLQKQADAIPTLSTQQVRLLDYMSETRTKLAQVSTASQANSTTLREYKVSLDFIERTLLEIKEKLDRR